MVEGATSARHNTQVSFDSKVSHDLFCTTVGNAIVIAVYQKCITSDGSVRGFVLDHVLLPIE